MKTKLRQLEWLRTGYSLQHKTLRDFKSENIYEFEENKQENGRRISRSNEMSASK